MIRKRKLKMLIGAIFILMLLSTNLIIFIITASNYKYNTNEGVNVSNSENDAKGDVKSDLASDTKSDSKDKVVVKNINNWQHPIKEHFKNPTLLKVELLYNKTYPIFYVNEKTLTEEEVVKKYSSGLYSSMLEANGYWDFEIRSLDNKWVKIKGDKNQKKVIDIVFEGKTINLADKSIAKKTEGN